jgi:hypothetical protein
MNEQNTRSSEALDLATLDQLEKKAHPAPWFGEDITEDGLTVIDDGLTANDRLFPIKCEGHEAALIVALRNAAPALIARARRADELERSLQTKDAEIARLKDADVEHEASFDLRWKADMRAIERWRGARKDRELILPDHADLCVNALDWVETAESALKDRDAEVERLKSAWQERENEALTLRAANADFARSFSELQDELAAAQQDTARLDFAANVYDIYLTIEGKWLVKVEPDSRGFSAASLRAAIDAARSQQIEVKP